ncbi:MAG: DUF1761 domain-containing protein [Rhodospirillaceae bacterium]|jgi:hypothetical protein|nr:DUF1761 domain-containing protein [Rhodospirillaceae bacterium]MBT6442113.1 DUF1761 domain-containing protein [Alphaproteobacteria bacterium]
MQFAGVNYMAVAAAAAGAFFFGFAYYMTLGKFWMVATGKSEEALKAGGMAKPMIITAICQLIMAFMLGGILGHLGAEQINLQGGLITGLFVWFGFAITATAVNYAWQRSSPMLTLIDGGHWLGCLAIQGMVLGAMGV